MEYNTGILKTNVGQFGVTEGEFICLIIHVFTGIFGQDFWAIRLGGFLPASILDIVVNKFPDINVS